MIEELKEKLNSISNINELNSLKAKYLGKAGKITLLIKELGKIEPEKRKEEGQKINELKGLANALLEEKQTFLNKEIELKKLDDETIDVDLPSLKIPFGNLDILEKLIEELEEFLMSMGFDVVEGPEVEQDLYNFELLNLPIGHSARDAQDTFYIQDESLLLRSQTSPVQIRTMLQSEIKKPIRIICPGKVYRRDEDDATHSHQFTQMEGLLIDKDVSLANLKYIFDEIAKKLFGNETKTRFRPSFYPFTEPSVELDISCFNCTNGCNICKKTTWITVGGAGMVHPNVLNNCGYDADEWKGFAFGFGLERLAMLKYNIKDVRVFYMNDLRNREIFDRKDV